MAAAEVARTDGAGDLGAAGEGAVPVKNTFIHFGAKNRRTLRMCVTDPADPTPVQARGPAREEAGAVRGERADSGLEGRPAAIREEATIEPEEPKPLSGALRLGPVALDEGDSAAGVGGPSNQELLQIQTPEASPRHASSSPWSAPAPASGLAASGLSRATPASSPHPQLLAATAGASDRPSTAQATQASSPLPQLLADTVAALSPDNAIASCSSRTPATPVSSSPALGGEGLHSFRFTLRLADDVGLGVDLAADACGGLRVQGVLPSGAIDAWNRRCLDGSATAGKVVHAGDSLVCVNNKTDCQGMLGECRGKLLLTLTFVRRVAPEDFSAAAPGELAEQYTGRPGRAGRDSPKVFLQIHAALEGERLHASKSLLMQGGQ